VPRGLESKIQDKLAFLRQLDADAQQDPDSEKQE
jgi:putative ATPase